MSIYTESIKPLEDQGMTDSEIADTLKASGVTNKKIELATLRHVLNMHNMMRKVIRNNADEKWSGSLMIMQDAILAGGDTDAEVAAKNGITLWMSHITNPTNIYWDTTDIQFAAAFWLMVQTFADLPGMPSAEDFQAVVDLGGGWKWSDLTEAKVAEYRAEHQDQQRKNSIDSVRAEIENDYINPAMADGESTPEQVRAAIKAGL